MHFVCVFQNAQYHIYEIRYQPLASGGR
jgi:hypothetical protein